VGQIYLLAVLESSTAVMSGVFSLDEQLSQTLPLRRNFISRVLFYYSIGLLPCQDTL
jgi:hypothetical protein